MSDALISQSSEVLLLVLLVVLLPLRLDVRAVCSPLRLRDSISITDDSGGSAKRTFLCSAAAEAELVTAVLVGRLYRREIGSKSPRYVTVEWYDTVGVMTGPGRRLRLNTGDDDDDDGDDGDDSGLRDEAAADKRRSVQPCFCNIII